MVTGLKDTPEGYTSLLLGEPQVGPEIGGSKAAADGEDDSLPDLDRLEIVVSDRLKFKKDQGASAPWSCAPLEGPTAPLLEPPGGKECARRGGSPLC